MIIFTTSFMRAPAPTAPRNRLRFPILEKAGVASSNSFCNVCVCVHVIVCQISVIVMNKANSDQPCSSKIKQSAPNKSRVVRSHTHLVTGCKDDELRVDGWHFAATHGGLHSTQQSVSV